jgi:hypothetical protein
MENLKSALEHVEMWLIGLIGVVGFLLFTIAAFRKRRRSNFSPWRSALHAVPDAISNLYQDFVTKEVGEREPWEELSHTTIRAVNPLMVFFFWFTLVPVVFGLSLSVPALLLGRNSIRFDGDLNAVTLFTITFILLLPLCITAWDVGLRRRAEAHIHSLQQRLGGAPQVPREPR